jgi:hypothetical protein
MYGILTICKKPGRNYCWHRIKLAVGSVFLVRIAGGLFGENKLLLALDLRNTSEIRS